MCLGDDAMIKITKLEVEEALGKLLFNITASIYCKSYHEYSLAFEKMLNILNIVNI